MPTIPKTAKLTASSIDIINTIRANADSTYQSRIPVATQENIRQVGNAIMQFEATQNAFISALVNRIARVIITSKMYENPLRMFKKGMMEFGETVEEVFVNIAKAHQFDPAVAEKKVFEREIPNVDAVFHKMNLQNFYKVTISVDQLRQAFLSMDGVTDLIARIVDSLYTGANYDEFLTMKQLIVDAANQGKFYPVNVPTGNTEEAMKSTIAIIKGISNSLEFMNAQYNPMGVLTHTAKEDQILIVDAKYDAYFDVEVLASAFNMDKAQFMGQRVLIDNFGTLTGVVAALVDRDWFMVFDNMIQFTENYNGEGLYWNYFYHVWKTFSTSPFANAILFTTSSIAANNVVITPATATVTKGDTLQLNATVSGTGYIPQDVTWSVAGSGTAPVATTSTVSPTGLLTVATTEANTQLTVTATSLFDPTKSQSAVITVA